MLRLKIVGALRRNLRKIGGMLRLEIGGTLRLKIGDTIRLGRRKIGGMLRLAL